MDDPKTGFSQSCVKSLHLPKSKILIDDHFKTKPRTITLQKDSAMNVLNISLSRASRTRKSFLSNSIDNNLSGKVLFQTAASPCCFPIFEHSCLFLREIFVCWRVAIFRIQIQRDCILAEQKLIKQVVKTPPLGGQEILKFCNKTVKKEIFTMNECLWNFQGCRRMNFGRKSFFN